MTKTLAQQLEDANAKIQELENKAAKSDGDAKAAESLANEANSKVTDLEAKLAAKDSEVNKLKAERDQAIKERDEVKAAATDFETKVAAKAAEIAASQGVPAVETKPKADPAKSQSDLSHLSGFERAKAALKQNLKK